MPGRTLPKLENHIGAEVEAKAQRMGLNFRCVARFFDVDTTTIGNLYRGYHPRDADWLGNPPADPGPLSPRMAERVKAFLDPANDPKLRELAVKYGDRRVPESAPARDDAIPEPPKGQTTSKPRKAKRRTRRKKSGRKAAKSGNGSFGVHNQEAMKGRKLDPTGHSLPNCLGAQLRSKAAKLGLSNRAVGAFLGIHPSDVTAYYRGFSRNDIECIDRKAFEKDGTVKVLPVGEERYPAVQTHPALGGPKEKLAKAFLTEKANPKLVELRAKYSNSKAAPKAKASLTKKAAPKANAASLTKKAEPNRSVQPRSFSLRRWVEETFAGFGQRRSAG